MPSMLTSVRLAKAADQTGREVMRARRLSCGHAYSYWQARVMSWDHGGDPPLLCCLLFRLCSGRRRSAAANSANQRAVKPQARWHTRRYGSHRPKFELYFNNVE